MKRLGWSLLSLSRSPSTTRRKLMRTYRSAELLEVRAMLDASSPLVAIGELFGEEVRTAETETIYTLGSTATPELTRFESREQLAEFLINQAVASKEQYFGRSVSYITFSDEFLVDTGYLPAVSVASDPQTNAGGGQVPDIGDVNIAQSAGIYLYALKGRDLLIMKAVPASDVQQMSRVRLDHVAVAMHVDGDRVTVISVDYNPYYSAYSGTHLHPTGTGQTIVSVFDVSDRSNPRLEKETTLDGSYVESRMTAGKLRTTTNYSIWHRWPDLEEIVVDGSTQELRGPRQAAVYESREHYIERLRGDADKLFEDTMPYYKSVTSDGLALKGLLSEADDISRIVDGDSRTIVSTVTIDTRDTFAGLVASSSVFCSGTSEVHVNQEHLIVLSPLPNTAQTRIMQLGWSSGAGELEVVGTGVLNGRPLGPFSIDEFEGQLRVFSSDRRYDTSAAIKHLVIFQNVDGVFAEVGRSGAFRFDGFSYSVQFRGTQAFLVTPSNSVTIFDLSDPTHPAEKGLRLPERPTYLQQIDEDHLLAIWGGDWRLEPKVGVFDLSGATNFRELDTDAFPIPASMLTEKNRRAIRYYPAQQEIAVPATTKDAITGVEKTDLLVFKINTSAIGEGAIELAGTISDDSTVRWSAANSDTSVLYAFADNSLIVAQLEHPNEIIESVDINPRYEFAHIDREALTFRVDDGARNHDTFVVLSDAATTTRLPDDMGHTADHFYIRLLESDGDIHVTLANDTVTVTSAGHAPKTFEYGGLPLVIDGSMARDRIYLNFASPRISNRISVSGKLGNDTIVARNIARSLAGVVTINGDEGNDWVLINSAVRVGVRFDGGNGRDTLTGSSGRDSIDGGAGDDVLNGSAGADFIYGRNGNDMLIGGLGDDYLNGGNGHDTVEGGEGADALRGASGNDRINGGNGANFIQGDEGNDTLTGGRNNDRLDGGVGDDVISGGDGNDQLVGRDGRDSLLGEGGRDDISGGLGDDTMDGGVADDTLHGGDGNDFVYGRNGNDRMMGGVGNDYLNGGNGNDTIDGGQGADVIRGSFGDDIVTDGSGRNYIQGDEGNDTLTGGGNSDRISGGVGDDSILGQGGDDMLFGDDGNDTLVGGVGIDVLSGGLGDDFSPDQDQIAFDIEIRLIRDYIHV